MTNRLISARHPARGYDQTFVVKGLIEPEFPANLGCFAAQPHDSGRALYHKPITDASPEQSGAETVTLHG